MNFRYNYPYENCKLFGPFANKSSLPASEHDVAADCSTGYIMTYNIIIALLEQFLVTVLPFYKSFFLTSKCTQRHLLKSHFSGSMRCQTGCNKVLRLCSKPRPSFCRSTLYLILVFCLCVDHQP